MTFTFGTSKCMSAGNQCCSYFNNEQNNIKTQLNYPSKLKKKYKKKLTTIGW